MSRWQENLADLIIRKFPQWRYVEAIKRAHVYDGSEIKRAIGCIETKEDALASTKIDTVGPICKTFENNLICLGQCENVNNEGINGHVGVLAQFVEREADDPEDVRWQLRLSALVVSSDKIYYPEYSDYAIRLNQSGQIRDMKTSQHLLTIGATLSMWALNVYPALMVLCLASRCTKYISIKEPDAVARRKHIKKFGTDLVVQRCITIPRRDVVYKTGGHDGSPRRLHWVSGHYKPPQSVAWTGEGERPYIEPYLRGDPRLGFCKTSYWAKAAMGAMTRQTVTV